MKKYSAIIFLFLTACVNSNFQKIEGKSADSLREMKGAPMTILQENGREMWTYRDKSCTQMIFLDDDGKVVDLYERGMCETDE